MQGNVQGLLQNLRCLEKASRRRRGKGRYCIFVMVIAAWQLQQSYPAQWHPAHIQGLIVQVKWEGCN
jgi:hypothetical protein